MPAVVGMQMPWRDSAAALFMRAFYATLLNTGCVEQAVQQGREALRGTRLEWGVPVLYRAGDTSELFTFPNRAAVAPPTNLRQSRAANFVGREQALEQLDELLSREPAQPVALWGISGLGKTQLALEYALAQLEQRSYPGGVFWLNAATRDQLEREYAALGGFFDLPAELPVSERAALVRNRLQALPRPALLVIDNLESEEDMILPPGGQCRAIVTTRLNYLPRSGCRGFELPVLDDEAALALLQSVRRASDDGDRSAARAIAQLLGHLPMALRLVAHYVGRRRQAFTSYIEELRAHLATPSGARKLFGSIYDTIALTQRSLPGSAWRVMEVAACFAPHDIAVDLLARAGAAEEADEFHDALADLEEASLIARDESGQRLSLHPLVSQFAFLQMPEAARGSAVARVATVLTEALRADNDVMEWTGARREFAHVQAARSHALPLAAHTLLHPLDYELGRFHAEHEEREAAVVAFQSALAAAETTQGAQSLAVAHCLRELAQAEQLAQPTESAVQYARQAHALAEAQLLPGAAELGDFQNDLGLVLTRAGQLTEGCQWYQRALATFEAAHGRRHSRVAMCLNNLAMLHLRLKDYPQSETLIREALDIDRELLGTNHELLAVRLNNLGQVLRKLDRLAEAEQHHREALRVYERVYGECHFDVAYTHRFVAELLAQQGQWQEAREHFLSALETLEKMGCFPRHCQEIRERMRSVAASPTDLSHR